jgi:glutamine synthetase adenylyltransferase
MLGLMHRDLNGLADLGEVFDTMTALAEECIAAASAEAHRRAAERYGEPAGAERLAVAGLGKLGGCELNVSSDVDLVFLYGAEGETGGGAPCLAPRVLRLHGAHADRAAGRDHRRGTGLPRWTCGFGPSATAARW